MIVNYQLSIFGARGFAPTIHCQLSIINYQSPIFNFQFSEEPGFSLSLQERLGVDDSDGVLLTGVVEVELPEFPELPGIPELPEFLELREFSELPELREFSELPASYLLVLRQRDDLEVSLLVALFNCSLLSRLLLLLDELLDELDELDEDDIASLFS